MYPSPRQGVQECVLPPWKLVHSMHSMRWYQSRLPAPGILTLGMIPALLLSDTGSAPAARSLQDAIDAALPGDTVWVAPGDYPRPVTVTKDITILAQGSGVRMAGISGSEATVVGITLDGSLRPGGDTMVRSGSDMTFLQCSFVGSTSGVTVQSGAEQVRLEDCTFDGLVQAIRLEADAGSVFLTRCELNECGVGITSDAFLCEDAPSRAPAQRCARGECGRLSLVKVRITGGEQQISLGGNFFLTMIDSRLVQGTQALSAYGCHVEITECIVSSVGGTGTGLRFASVSGFVRLSTILSWETGIEVGDGGCPRFTSLEIGGSLEQACSITNAGANLLVTQPEPIPADFNYWGSTDCKTVNMNIEGQDVCWITGPRFALIRSCPCSGTPVEASTWGGVKKRYDTGGGAESP